MLVWGEIGAGIGRRGGNALRDFRRRSGITLGGLAFSLRAVGFRL